MSEKEQNPSPGRSNGDARKRWSERVARQNAQRRNAMKQALSGKSDATDLIVDILAELDKKANGATLIALVALGVAVFACGMAVSR